MLSGGWKGFGCECEKVHFMGIPDRGQKGAGPERQGWNGMAARLRLGVGQGGGRSSCRARLGRAIRFGKFPGPTPEDGERSSRTGGWEQMVNPGQGEGFSEAPSGRGNS